MMTRFTSEEFICRKSGRFHSLLLVRRPLLVNPNVPRMYMVEGKKGRNKSMNLLMYRSPIRSLTPGFGNSSEGGILPGVVDVGVADNGMGPDEVDTFVGEGRLPGPDEVYT